MKMLFLVGLGGGLGAIARYLLSVWVLQLTPGWRFPTGTFAVNLLGCFVAGTLLGVMARQGEFPEAARLFLFVGLLGGFTTFSAFGVETMGMLQRGDPGLAALYVGLSVSCGLALLWGGTRLSLILLR